MLELLLRKLSQWLSKRNSQSKPAETEYKSVSVMTITNAELFALLTSHFPNVPVYMSDSLYRLCHPDDMAWFLANDATNRLEYEAETYDCDNFARTLWGNFGVKGWADLTFGICWTELHALNLFIDVDKNIWFLEPQTDEIQSRLKSWQGQSLRFIIM